MTAKELDEDDTRTNIIIILLHLLGDSVNRFHYPGEIYNLQVHDYIPDLSGTTYSQSSRCIYLWDAMGRYIL